MAVECPKCHGTSSARIESDGFHVVAPRRCLTCAHVWEPEAPAAYFWGGMGLLVAFTLLFSFGFVSAVLDTSDPVKGKGLTFLAALCLGLWGTTAAMLWRAAIRLRRR